MKAIAIVMTYKWNHHHADALNLSNLLKGKRYIPQLLFNNEVEFKKSESRFVQQLSSKELGAHTDKQRRDDSCSSCHPKIGTNKPRMMGLLLVNPFLIYLKNYIF